MGAHHLALSSLITLSFFLAILPLSYCTDDARFVDCSRPYECGRIKNVSYPFWGGNRPQHCGLQGFKLECYIDDYPIIKFEEPEFLVVNINQSQNIMTIARLDLWDGSCPQTYLNTVLNYSIFDYATIVLNITLFYDCPSQVNTLIPVQNRFTCSLEGSDANNNAYFVNELLAKIHILEPEKCRGKILVPISQNAIIDESTGVVPALHEALNQGLEMNYDVLRVACSGCVESGGNCGSNVTRQYETAMVRKMILVGLWCIQTNPSDRPSMSKVIEMLEGNIEALQIPPKPFLSSPPRSSPAEESSTY